MLALAGYSSSTGVMMKLCLVPRSEMPFQEPLVAIGVLVNFTSSEATSSCALVKTILTFAGRASVKIPDTAQLQ